MIENVGRKLTLIGVLLTIALLCLVVPAQPFRLGLDLRGGTRLVYRFDFEQAKNDGKITEVEYNDRAQLLQNFTAILRERVDPQGVYEPIIRAQGLDRVVIEIPGVAELASAKAEGALDAADRPLQKTARALTLAADEETLRKFPTTGGVIRVGDEKIRYSGREGAVLSGLQRGYQATEPAEHQNGESIQLISDDSIRNAIESTGEMHFYLGASQVDFSSRGTDLQKELERVQAWMKANPDRPLSAYNALARAEGGAPDDIYWYPRRLGAGDTPRPESERLAPLVLPPEKWRFTGDDVDLVRADQDKLGYPAVFFRLKPIARQAFGDFTEAHVQELLGIVMNEEIATLATIETRLPGESIISGGASGFTRTEVDELVTVLRSGSLKIRPVLEAEERVGASLGDEYVRRGFMSAILGLVLVLVFMVGYYRRLGIYADISLLANLVLLMGAMAFLQATLTLPGIAGIILTVGMAVDANILIYERIREETLRGSKVLQAAKSGFEKALSTIVDANLTTLITAMILLKIGTGPVRGFATTLSVGIITSMFAALVITRVLVHLQVTSKSLREFKMGRLVGETHFPFMKIAPMAIAGSLLLIVLGVSLFASLPNRDKLGIDFTGGFSLSVRTEEPQPIQTMRDVISAIPGAVGEAEVKPILDSGSPDTGFTAFRVTGKMSGDRSAMSAQEGAELTGEREIRDALTEKGLLQKPAVQIDPIDPATGAVAGHLRFERTHRDSDIVAALTEAGLTTPTVQAGGAVPGRYTFNATTTSSNSAQVWEEKLRETFNKRADSTGAEMRLALQIPEAEVVGAQVVGELRDKAVIAILASLFCVVMYIRFRFAEYSYGLAAVIAVVHDVLITLGFLGVAVWTGAIEAEISLPMIAAFLTIIGYSLNDTIVVFDRIRENLPRMKLPLSEILNASINQTLSRTILTSLTTLMAVLILFFLNLGSRNVLEGFAYALAVGIIVGTYSSIFIASPVLLWLEGRGKGSKSGGRASKSDKATEKKTPEVEAAV